jgi:hypothetical protein
MNIVLPLEQFNINHIFFENSVKNIVLDDSDFIKIIYSNELCVLNNLYLSFHINTNHYEDVFKKRKYYFLKYNNLSLKNIIDIEKDLLNLVNINNLGGTPVKPLGYAGCPCNLQPSFGIKETLENGYINCVKGYSEHYSEYNFTSDRREILLKISGIWVTKTNYGITFKFIDVSNQTLNHL